MKRSLISFAVFALLLTAEAAAQRDSIERTDGNMILKVTIIEETIQNVVYRKSGVGQQRVPSDKVKEVKYYSPSSDYKTAMETYAKEDYATACSLFEEFASNLDPDKKGALLAFCMYRAAECRFKMGEWDTARQGFTDFANMNQNHRLYPNALLERVKCYINTGNRDKALGGINTLKGMIDKKGLSEYWKYEVEYWTIFLGESKSPDRALKNYRALFDTVKDSYPDVANKARLRIGRVLIQQKKFEEAESYFGEIIKNRFDADREVVAGAYLGRGTCLIRKAKATNDDFKDALYDFLRVVVHYPDVGAPQAESMYWAGFCFQRLGGKDSTKRWQTLYRRIKTEWPGTLWAQEAAKQVK